MPKYNNISAIILAAGYSSRMGDHKPLLKMGSYTAIEHAVRCFLQAGVSDVRVVVGFQAEKVREVVEPMGCTVIYNADFPQGMYSSVQAGVRSLEQNMQAFFILPVDSPLISHTTIMNMLDCYQQNQQQGIICPVFNGQRGHPPLISARYQDEIVNHVYPNGLRGFHELHKQETHEFEVQDEAVLLDMDTPEDYGRLLNYLNRRNKPTLIQCWNILCEAGTKQRVREHSWMVAFFALELVSYLNEAGAALDEDLVLASALLHDISRHEPGHAQVGAKLLESMGYPLVGAVVSMHMDIEVSEDHPLTEAELIYLADKMVDESSVVSVQERFAVMLQKYKDNFQASAAVVKRLQQAERIIKKVEKIMDYPLGALCAAMGFDLSEQEFCHQDDMYMPKVVLDRGIGLSLYDIRKIAER